VIPLLRLGVPSGWDRPPQAQKGMRVPAGDMERLVLDRLRAFFSSRTDVSNALVPLDLDAHTLDVALRNALKHSERWLAAPPVEMTSLVRGIVERVTVAADPVVVSIEAKLRRAGKGKRLVIENGAEAEVNAGLAAMIAEAFAIQKQLLSGSDATIEAMTERLGIAKGRLTSLVRLSAPDIVRALLKGRQPIELTPTRLLRLSKDLPPHDWIEQGQFLGFAHGTPIISGQKPPTRKRPRETRRPFAPRIQGFGVSGCR
jgi:site-specific DNA recombinase